MLPAMDSEPLIVAVHPLDDRIEKLKRDLVALPPSSRVKIWMTCIRYLAWVASVRFRRHVLAYVAAIALALLGGAATYAVALIIAAMRATP
jgi:hypothetical protein